ncbi:MAG: 2-C-methyl-D-erythritol 4-phosphate cytidylyltransferase [Flavipsychrobacter sp.]|nr:2-C-methyl-D-erythritol 4-phosphate cytidylyltransferase [Flavipsychrobacter sp.]
MSDNKKYAVIVAGGKGSRMGSPIPKQFLPFLGKPLLCYAIEAFADAMPGIKIILVLPGDQLKSAQTVLRSYIGDIDVTVVAGGETRFHSVQNGLQKVNNDGVVFVHDGARPLISSDLIQRCYKQTMEKGSAIPAITVADSMRIVEDDSSRAVNREHLRIVQTPQTFKTEMILPAFTQSYHPSFTDEATVVEAAGSKVHLIDGLHDNIKITIPEDMVIAEVLLKARA